MYNYYQPSFDLNLAQLDKKAAQFKALKHPGELASLLKADAALVNKLAQKPHYYQFTIPKPGGQKRIIHNPYPDLKNLQATLNLYLQCAYYQIMPPAAYGFIPKPTDERRPRNLYTNALQHQDALWVLNMDMKDYFHTVNSRHLTNIFRDIFEFAEPLVNQLIGLCSCRGVLPMGASTSPVLSNLAALPLDLEMQGLSRVLDATYTRYVDDMTFGFDEEPTQIVVDEIKKRVERQGFRINDAKTRITHRDQGPEVTGLILQSPRPDVSESFLKKLKKDIKLLRKLTSPDVMERGIFHASVLDKLKQSIEGKLNFLGFIRGKKDVVYLEYAAMV
jgi:hypothetical protein